MKPTWQIALLIVGPLGLAACAGAPDDSDEDPLGTVSQASTRATLISPSGGGGQTPVYKWYAVTGATSYTLRIRTNGAYLPDVAVTPEAAGCSGGGICQYQEGTELALDSSNVWWIDSNAPDHAWSPSLAFTATLPPPTRATLLSPSGTGPNAPTYQWEAVAGATSYTLRIRTNGVYLPDAVVASAAAGCDGGGVCSYVEGTSLAAGTTNVWWVDSDVFNHTWSSSLNFVAGGLPNAPAPLSPINGVTTGVYPVFTWTAATSADEYQLNVRTTFDGVLTTHDFTAAELGCSGGGTCTLSSVFVSAGLNYYWIRASNAQGASAWTARQEFTAVGPTVPGAPTLSFPTGSNVYVDKPTYRWFPASNGTPATGFSLEVSQGANVLVAETYTVAEAGCDAVGTFCQVMPDIVIPEGTTEWRVTATNDYGGSLWKQTSWESHSAAVPPLPSQTIGVAPAGVVTTNPPKYEWYASPFASRYHLLVRDSLGTNTVETSYTSLEANCGGAVTGYERCSATPPVPLASGSYEFLVAYENSEGTQDYAPPRAFSIGAEKAALVGPTGSSGSVPTYQWTSVAGATSYTLRIRSNGVYLPDVSVTPAAAGCDIGGLCSFVEGTSLAPFSYNVWWIDSSAANHAWSVSLSFSVALDTPIPISPAEGQETSPHIAFVWMPVADAESYQLRIETADSSVTTANYSASHVGCDRGGVCSTAQTVTALASGAATYSINVITAQGTSDWSPPRAFTVIQGTPTPYGAIPLYPDDSPPIHVDRPVYEWYVDDAYAEAFRLELFERYGNGPVLFSRTYTREEAECACPTCNYCSIMPDFQLLPAGGWGTPNDYMWRIQEISLYGDSDRLLMYFTLGSVTVPASPIGQSPSGPIATTTPTYQWTAADNATSYRLLVQDSTLTHVIDETYTSFELGCYYGAQPCVITPPVALASGTAQFWVSAANGAGSSPYSEPTEFTVP